MSVFISFLIVLFSLVSPAHAATGAIYTTDLGCTGVNVNLFAGKDTVYLDGGPHHSSASGLADGAYFVKVTVPDGTLLSALASTPQVHVTNGNFDQCYKLSDILVKASDQTPGYDTTTNGGGEYKVWVSPNPTFDNGTNKTDNFKVVAAPAPQVGSISGTKWEDANANGVFDGGEETLPGWTIDLWNADHSTLLSSATTDSVGYSFDNLTPGTYQVCEATQNGWFPSYPTTSTPNCNTNVVVAGNQNTLNVNFGNYQNVSLTVVKHVVNDNGGGAVAGAFTMGVSGTSVSNDSFSGDEAGVTVTLKPGDYSVSESGGPDGYVESDSVDCSGTATSGQQITCTITNDDIQPKLTVTKVVVNDNGGAKIIEDFPLSVDTTNVTSSVQVGVDAGSHTISEVGDLGYAATITGDCASDGSISLSIGDVKSCTITNDDIAPSLTLNKIVTNDNGGGAVATDWTLTAAGPTPISGAGGATSGATFSAGVYSLSESAGPFGYSASDWVCDNATVTNGQITLDLAQTATCSITNDDIAPQLVVIKHVINNDWGLNIADNFSMLISGTVTPTPITFSGAETGVMQSLPTAGSYTVGESGPAGYTSSYSGDCTGTIGIGETKTCTITNDDLPGRMTGGGSIFTINGDTPTKVGTRVTHGFELLCKNPTGANNRLEINWNVKGNKSDKFHLDRLTSVTCLDNPNINPGHPESNGFDTFVGTGTGSYNGVSGYLISFTLTDAGEPGKNDTAMYTVSKGSSPVLNIVAGRRLDNGNQQSHRF